ncbi:hypothetical protein LZP69_11740 [Shewanella sp. AS1]|uniref:hypothetical protein n=1 Tax=Shewanella sp. AS1 TaxID=2907626 RepID=UPI001F410DC1|nr:hypothetical protein [Shewanella sp. AS1]MCE9679834.1 hypothetical protein [Shewanella sp. AS1]
MAKNGAAMYKIEVEEIDEKLSHIRKRNTSKFAVWGLGFAVLLVLFSEDTFPQFIAFGLFIYTLINHYYISPLLGKIDLLEEDIANLKRATETADVKHY